jgi:NAD(P) transhydrogenase subunit alpha
VGLSNLPGEVAFDASLVYGNNLFNLLEEYWDSENKELNFDISDEILSGCVVTHDGDIVNAMVKDRI